MADEPVTDASRGEDEGEPDRMFLRFVTLGDDDLSLAHHELRRVASATRRLSSALIRTLATREELALVADSIEGLAGSIEATEHMTMFEGFAEAANAGQDLSASFDYSPFLGLANPLSPPMRISEGEGGGVVGKVQFGAAYEGPPGCVHGGFVAAVFDELLGVVQSIGGPPGMTGRLTIHYRSPTPLHVPLRMEGRLVSRVGRKILTEGKIFDGDRLCAEAEGLFISIDAARWGELLSSSGRR